MAGKDDGDITAAATTIADALERAGMRVLLDDRVGVSPGVKFKDAELLGMPSIVVAGRGVANGMVEVRNRISGATNEVAIADAPATVLAHAQAN
jgi:prolyl-tRNA synthetase